MITKKVGLRIKELRLSKNISQEQCAMNANINRAYLAGVELGKRNISIINLNKICISFNISLKDFFNSKIFNED
ncbi:helix-turn-helix transcriptional regulator [Brachyspira pilosicoli]|uniref:helix-turn-helix domain-containing protein n=1 Tax=Brachyspira pilosicoli TaxID=52584 RepID=UPI003003A99A